MAAKGIFVLFVQAVLAQTAFSQCIGAFPGVGLGAGLAPGLAFDGLARGCASFAPTASSGGSFVVTSSSPVAPTGITVVSENIYEGALVVGGNLPMLGSVGVEGEFPTAGAGAVSYGCGDGDVGIVAEEGPIVTGIAEPVIAAPYALSAPCGVAAPFGYGYGIGYGLGYGIGSYGLRYGAGCGCRAFY